MGTSCFSLLRLSISLLCLRLPAPTLLDSHQALSLFLLSGQRRVLPASVPSLARLTFFFLSKTALPCFCLVPFALCFPLSYLKPSEKSSQRRLCFIQRDTTLDVTCRPRCRPIRPSSRLASLRPLHYH
ncbi:hypothetical protein GGI42DRAFT_122207 [Trichoderma sp. SZMC 28013]